MYRLTRILMTATLMAGLFLTPGQNANADRVGGPVSDTLSVIGYQSLFFEIPFSTAGRARVFIVGNGTSPMEVYMYDGDGNFAVGRGIGDRKVVEMRVYREGTFRVEVRNLGPATNTFTIYTN